MTLERSGPTPARLPWFDDLRDAEVELADRAESKNRISLYFEKGRSLEPVAKQTWDLPPDAWSRTEHAGRLGTLPATVVTMTSTGSEGRVEAHYAEVAGWVAVLKIENLDASDGVFTSVPRTFRAEGVSVVHGSDARTFHLGTFSLAVPTSHRLDRMSWGTDGEAFAARWPEEGARSECDNSESHLQDGMDHRCRLQIGGRCLVIRHRCLQGPCKLDHDAAVEAVVDAAQ